MSYEENQDQHVKHHGKKPGCGCVGCFFAVFGVVFLLPLLAIAGIIFSCYYAVYLEPSWVRVQRVAIEQPELAAALSGIKIVQLSDIHTIDQIREIENRMVEVTNALQPDIILITGDFISKREGFKPCMEAISRLKARVGIWGIIGNCDTSVGDYRWEQEAKKAGMTMLFDERKRIELSDGKRLWLLGASNHGNVEPYLKRLTRGIKKNDAVILLDHDPANIETSSLFDIDLVLSGDTHGAQCGVRWIRQFYGWKSKYLAGLYRVRDTYLYVHRGLGWHHKPVRFLCWPEVTLLTFATDVPGTKIKEPEPERENPTELHYEIRAIWQRLTESRLRKVMQGDID